MLAMRFIERWGNFWKSLSASHSARAQDDGGRGKHEL